MSAKNDQYHELQDCDLEEPHLEQEYNAVAEEERSLVEFLRARRNYPPPEHHGGGRIKRVWSGPRCCTRRRLRGRWVISELQDACVCLFCRTVGQTVESRVEEFCWI
jgi:hypothetical protein